MFKKYFRAPVLLILCLIFSSASLFAQDDIKIEMLESSKAPISESLHFYKFQVENVSSRTSEVTINFQNVDCGNVAFEEVSLNYSLLNANKQSTSETIKLNPRERRVYYLKSSRPANTKLQSYSCVEIYATTSGKRVSNASLTVKQLIPDPSLEN
ncbi:MAG: hypothetical protein CMC74_02390 [Flavobacteriaceae bacterium]|nr:hypothetical protein [Flavobacteriaceae bacterium]